MMIILCSEPAVVCTVGLPRRVYRRRREHASSRGIRRSPFQTKSVCVIEDIAKTDELKYYYTAYIIIVCTWNVYEFPDNIIIIPVRRRHAGKSSKTNASRKSTIIHARCDVILRRTTRSGTGPHTHITLYDNIVILLYIDVKYEEFLIIITVDVFVTRYATKRITRYITIYMYR